MGETGYMAGCNYFYTDDTKTMAVSMHDCDDCTYTLECKMKRTSIEWPISPEIEAEIEAEGKRLRGLLSQALS